MTDETPMAAAQTPSEAAKGLLLDQLTEDQLAGFGFGCAYALGVLSIAEATLEQRQETVLVALQEIQAEARRRKVGRV